jgi:hypothetical protein
MGKVWVLLFNCKLSHPPVHLHGFFGRIVFWQCLKANYHNTFSTYLNSLAYNSTILVQSSLMCLRYTKVKIICSEIDNLGLRPPPPAMIQVRIQV